MPNRILKESIFTDDCIASLTDFEFRVWVGLMLMADNYGCGDARAQIVKSRVFVFDETVTASRVSSALRAMAEKKAIAIFMEGDKPRFYLSGWEHQQQDAGRRTPDYKEWRRKVFERDDYTCQRCHKRGGKLEAHHIRRYRSDIGGRVDIDNGITLCAACHKIVHSEEGR